MLLDSAPISAMGGLPTAYSDKKTMPSRLPLRIDSKEQRRSTPTRRRALPSRHGPGPGRADRDLRSSDDYSFVTTPLIAPLPKWLTAPPPKVTARLLAGTALPPVISTVTGEPVNPARPPLPAIAAVPVMR